MRYFIEIAYKGTHYFGWQKQPNAITVQEVLESCLTKMLREPIITMGAGRTDAGVHAKQLYAHFDCATILNTDNLVFRLNSFLPSDISVVSFYALHDDAHARFDAVGREYEYHISLQKNPFLSEVVHSMNTIPDVSLMNEACAILVEYTDFQCFSRSKTDVKTYHCTITKATWELDAARNTLVFTIAANRFLRNMVRAIVGTMLDIGNHKITLAQFITIIESKDRREAGASAPASGLFLTKVKYPEGYFNANNK